MRGSGTSESTAIASGAAALILSKFPNATPDQVKRLLKITAYDMPTQNTRPGRVRRAAPRVRHSSAPLPIYVADHRTARSAAGRSRRPAVRIT